MLSRIVVTVIWLDGLERGLVLELQKQNERLQHTVIDVLNTNLDLAFRRGQTAQLSRTKVGCYQLIHKMRGSVDAARRFVSRVEDVCERKKIQARTDQLEDLISKLRGAFAK